MLSDNKTIALSKVQNTADQVANYIIFKQQTIDAKKLQKLLYYCCAFYYTLESKYFCDNQIDFEAWVHGPVHPGTYLRFADKSKKMKKIKHNENMDHSCLSESEKGFIDEVIAFLGDYHGYQLEAMTHEEQPWLEKRKGLGELESGHKKISYTTIKNYYTGKVQRV